MRVFNISFNTDGRSAAWLMNGITMSSSGGLFGPATGWSPRLLGDVNGDAMADILWRHNNGGMSVWLMNGFTPSSSSVLLDPATGWSPDWVGELNGDAKSDIIWQHEDGSIAAWLMNGITFSGVRLLGPGTGWLPVP